MKIRRYLRRDAADNEPVVNDYDGTELGWNVELLERIRKETVVVFLNAPDGTSPHITYVDCSRLDA